MTLTAHAVVGAAIAAAIPTHPVLGICAAFASHFLVDAIPHYDYQIRSASIHPYKRAPIKLNRALVLDFFCIGGDFVLGLLLAMFFFATPTTWLLIMSAAFAGQLPDALQFAYAKWKHEPLISLQRFHQWIHTRNHMREHVVWGVVTQVAFLLVVIYVADVYIFF